METLCEICCEVRDSPYLKMRCCGQTLHKECLLEWTVKRPSGTQASCPFCRQTLHNMAEYASHTEIFTFLKRRKLSRIGRIEIVTSLAPQEPELNAQSLNDSFKRRCVVMVFFLTGFTIAIIIWQLYVVLLNSQKHLKKN